MKDNQIGRLLFLKRQYREAIAELALVLAVDPEDLQAHYNLMLCYQGLGKLEEARREETLYRRFKADESAQAITGPYRRLHAQALCALLQDEATQDVAADAIVAAHAAKDKAMGALEFDTVKAATLPAFERVAQVAARAPHARPGSARSHPASSPGCRRLSGITSAAPPAALPPSPGRPPPRLPLPAWHLPACQPLPWRIPPPYKGYGHCRFAHRWRRPILH